MYLTSLHIRGMKLLRDFNLDLMEGSSPRMWTVLLGENGRCKTSILRAIAMAALGAARSHEVADLPSLHDKRADGALRIETEFSLSPSVEFPSDRSGAQPSAHAGGIGVRSDLLMNSGWSSLLGNAGYRLGPRTAGGPVDDDIMMKVRATNERGWFVAGYGTSRFLPAVGATSPSALSNPAVARVASLFDRAPLIGTGFADLLENAQGFSAALRRVLIEEGRVLPPDAQGIELRGRGGIRSAADLVDGNRFIIRPHGGAEMKIPATWLSQGYQSTIAWIADLLGHAMLEAGERGERAESSDSAGWLDTQNLTGLVLIDEIDLHLHPAWQVRLVESLKRAFPKVQFVVTTHSPMILPALRAEEIFLLDVDSDGSVVARQSDVSPMLLTGSEIYSRFFGIEGLYPADLARDYQRYAFLVGNPARTDDEDREMLAVGAKLKQLGLDPGWTPVERDPS